MHSPSSGTGTENPVRAERGFHGLSREISDALETISTPMIYEKGTVLFVEGQRPLGVFVIHQGMVRLSASSADGKSLIVGRAGAGQTLGLPTAVSGNATELTAEAVQRVECSFVVRETFLQLLKNTDGAALRVAEIVSHMYGEAFDQIRYLGLSWTATEKLARLLLDLPVNESATTGTSKLLSLTHKEIAEMIGASRETVTRLFTRFKQEQLVRIHGTRLQIIDQKGLEQMLTL